MRIKSDRSNLVVVWSIAMTVFMSATAYAQTAPPPAFAGLIEGKKVVVTTTTGRQLKGVFEVSPDGLVAVGKEPGTPVPFDKVASVRRANNRVRNGAIAGFLITLPIAGIGVRYGHCENAGCSGYDEVWGKTLLWSGLGAAAGAAIGAAINSSKRGSDLLYQAGRKTSTISLSPILSPTRKGLALSMTWR